MRFSSVFLCGSVEPKTYLVGKKIYAVKIFADINYHII